VSIRFDGVILFLRISRGYGHIVIPMDWNFHEILRNAALSQTTDDENHPVSQQRST
jgi:hypothetical protein